MWGVNDKLDVRRTPSSLTWWTRSMSGIAGTSRWLLEEYPDFQKIISLVLEVLIFCLFKNDQSIMFRNSVSIEQSVFWGTIRVMSSAYFTRRLISDNVFNFLARNINKYGPRPEPWTILLVMKRNADMMSPNLTAWERPPQSNWK